jgi:hypothetical protein
VDVWVAICPLAICRLAICARVGWSTRLTGHVYFPTRLDR